MRKRKEITEEIIQWDVLTKGLRIKAVTLEVLLDIRDLITQLTQKENGK